MAARVNRWWGRAVIALALLAIVLFYAAGAAVLWSGPRAIEAFRNVPAADLVVALAELGWTLPGAVRLP